ncbi:uncharacterized protein MELLADRAFT_35076 [Melampsora larici-populina 98AG31]|uniref:Uncharacterized protein n=1 Tax=Melampsora larici-populina (strain 98AG31 / pathotype 3-4-7) TaxID=747676 RepID=F4RH91_MELLP|nr:uncharacterized protein MELLADRAFT_35076 [Melampsora larici-populina 98AG31]EGG08152.1 hypothetical protein MELLADRAFT_35076 [Melampsora larici-populina 98AG31]
MLGGDDTALLARSPDLARHEASIARDPTSPIQGPSSLHPSGHLLPPSQNLPTDPAQRTIVIHPGSRMLRIGRASDHLPISVPNVVARRRSSATKSSPNGVCRNFEPSLEPQVVDAFNSKIGSIRAEFRSRMRQIKLRGITNGQGIAANYNADVVPLVLSEDQDPLGTIWPPVTGPEARDLYIGEDALLIADPDKHDYAIRWPIHRGALNTAEDSGYDSKNEILADIEAVWLYALSNGLGIKEQELKEYSAIFILPDLYDHFYLREMVDLMFRTVGFKQICLQQESLCACFGAGLGTACVIDIGATKTSVSCVEEGWVLPETRLQMAYGGDDITFVLSEMLRRQKFPYKDLNLNRTWDWQMMERLKEDMVVLSEGDVGLNVYTFFSRHPNAPTQKWAVRAYDEVILSPMIMFTPQIIDFGRKFQPGKPLFSKDALEDMASPHSGTPQPTLVDSSAPTRRPSPSPATGKQTTGVLPVTQNAETPSIMPNATIIEASKLPLQEAVLHSILACNSEEKCRRMAGAIIIVGGGGLIHNVAYAITTRFPLLAARYPNIGETSSIPPPRDIDPKLLAWKGVSLLCRLDAANDLWIRSSDWEVLGSKGIKDRTMFMC